MVKRKTSCGNARRCSMLPTNVTRSASYEALPNHRPFPAKSGLTSRFPVRNRLVNPDFAGKRSEEHTSELQSHSDLVCRLLLEKKHNRTYPSRSTLRQPNCQRANA